MSFTVRANAKINLHLDIGPRRKDGYHELKTLFQEISLHDTLTFTPTHEGIWLQTTPAHIPQGKENIIVKALQALRTKLKMKKGMAVELQKNIPMGAGLGGGSADAAAALKAAWTIWRSPSARKIRSFDRVPSPLLECARKLGADVPFFLTGGTAWAEGIGEKLKRMKDPPQRWLILIYPRVHVSTSEAYKWLDQHRAGRKTKTPSDDFFNSFEPVILSKYRAIREARRALAELGCTGVMMSGSGSTVFGFVKDPAEGSRIFNRLQNKPWDIFLAHTC